MKKIISIISVSICLQACIISSHNIEKLQKQFDVVYKIDGINYICIDSLKNVYHVTTKNNGDIDYKIRIHGK
jgi:hypothetical protein